MKSMSVVDGYFVNASHVQRKKVAKNLITQWCDAVTQDAEEAFSQKWGLGDSRLVETPQRQKRRRKFLPEGIVEAAVAEAMEAAVADSPTEEGCFFTKQGRLELMDLAPGVDAMFALGAPDL